MTNALFICSRNRLRSPTAARVFDGRDGVDADSAGLAPDADCPLDADQVHWADIIFVMEKAHRARLTRKFGHLLRARKVVCLDIPDDHDYMAPALIDLLERKVAPHLKR